METSHALLDTKQSKAKAKEKFERECHQVECEQTANTIITVGARNEVRRKLDKKRVHRIKLVYVGKENTSQRKRWTGRRGNSFRFCVQACS